MSNNQDNQDNTINSSTDVQVNVCQECKSVPCVCVKNENDADQQTSEQKTRVKGSHRKGTPPKLKWI